MFIISGIVIEENNWWIRNETIFGLGHEEYWSKSVWKTGEPQRNKQRIPFL